MRGILTTGEDITIGGAFFVLDMRGRRKKTINAANTSGIATDIGTDDRIPADDDSSIANS